MANRCWWVGSLSKYGGWPSGHPPGNTPPGSRPRRRAASPNMTHVRPEAVSLHGQDILLAD